MTKDGSETINQCRTTSLVNVKGNIFLSVLAKWISSTRWTHLYRSVNSHHKGSIVDTRMKLQTRLKKMVVDYQ